MTPADLLAAIEAGDSPLVWCALALACIAAGMAIAVIIIIWPVGRRR